MQNDAGKTAFGVSLLSLVLLVVFTAVFVFGGERDGRVAHYITLLVYGLSVFISLTLAVYSRIMEGKDNAYAAFFTISVSAFSFGILAAIYFIAL